MIVRVLEALENNPRELTSVTRINYGTAPIPRDILRRGLERLGPVFRQHYGMTEAPQPLTLLYPHEHLLEGPEEVVRRIESCGRPTINVEITIRQENGSEAPLGEVGEIAVLAQGVADVTYWNNPENTRELIRDGWLYTGDLGWMDEAGYLFIVGRKKDMIISGGYNIYAKEVEDALYRHPQVLEAAVAGIPDPEWGESVCAFVVMKNGQRLSPEALIEHTRQLIASYKKPRHVEFLETLPKNLAGKVDKNRLREDFLSKKGTDASGSTSVQARY